MASLLLPCIAGAAVHAVETVCFYPAVSAVALCCYSMVEPSVFSAGPLLCHSQLGSASSTLLALSTSLRVQPARTPRD